MGNIKLMDFLNIAVRRLWILILAFIICAGGAFGVCEYVLTPVYSARSAIIVNNGAVTTEEALNNDKNSIANTDIAASLNLAETITDILKTPNIFRKLVVELDNEYTYNQLKGAISVSRRSAQSLFVDVRVNHTNPHEAMRIANTFVQLASGYIPEFIPNSIAVVAEEAVSASLVFPRTAAITLLSGFLGFVLAFIIVYIIDIRNDVVSSDEDFVLKYNIPLLGTVPDFEDIVKAKKKRGSFSHVKY